MEFNHLNNFKNSVITYVMNALTLSFASLTFIESADILLKCISVAIAVVVLYFTRKRLKRDLILRDIDIEVKQIQKQQEMQRLHILMEQSKHIGSSSNGTETKTLIE